MNLGGDADGGIGGGLSLGGGADIDVGGDAKADVGGGLNGGLDLGGGVDISAPDVNLGLSSFYRNPLTYKRLPSELS